jgi:hypothetical protein
MIMMMMMINWIGYGKKWSWPNLRNCPCICVEVLRKTTRRQLMVNDLRFVIWNWGLPKTKQRCFFYSPATFAR